MTALGEAFTELHRRRQTADYERGYAAGWYAAQLEQALERERSQPATDERLLRDAEAALREAEALLEHANLAWDGWKVADRIAAHYGRDKQADHGG